MPDHNPNAWLIHQSDHHKARSPKWRFVELLDSGEYVDSAHINNYLHKRAQGEHELMYEDRKLTLKPDLHFSNIIGRIVGQFTQSESELVITYEDKEREGGLGDPKDPTSRAWQIENDIDGKGTTLALWSSQLLHALLIFEEVYVLVKDPTFAHGPVHWIIIRPKQVTDLQESDGVLIAIKIESDVDRRGNLKEKPVTWRQVDLFEVGSGGEPGRQRRWEWEGDETKDATLIEDAPFKRFAQADSSEQRLPIVQSRLGLKKYMAYLVALSCNSLLNQVSELKNRLRIAATPAIIEKKAGTVKGGKTPNAQKRSEGWSWLTIGTDEDISFLDVPIAGVTEALAVLEDEREDIYITTFQSYEREAAQVTATAINAEALQGRVAWLTLIALSFDPIIQFGLFHTEQIEHPDGPWGVATAERSGPFLPDETEAAIERDALAFFPAGVPATEEMFTQALRQQAEGRGAGIKDEDKFIIDAALLYKQRRMRGFLADGFSFEQAARKAGLEGQEFEEAIRTDDVPPNGEVQ